MAFSFACGCHMSGVDANPLDVTFDLYHALFNSQSVNEAR